MNEDFLHFLWKFKLYNTDNLQTTDGEKIEVLSVGLPNNGSGPDFLNAQIKIGDTVWAGNVEIHIKSNDWVQHNHHVDKAYNNVILHVVQQNSGDAFRQNGAKIPMLVLTYNKQLEERYTQLLVSPIAIACQPVIGKIEPFYIRHFLIRLLVERLERKSAEIKLTLDNSTNNWRESFYQSLFRAFGFGANSLPFQMLAQATPLKVVQKYCKNAFQTEALLFGQAGFLEEEPLDDYQTVLKVEYIFLKTTYNLTPLDKSLWKFGRLRPSNFPTVRIAQLAQLVGGFDVLTEKVIGFESINDLLTTFKPAVSTYWETHYDFGKETDKRTKRMGKSSVEKLLSNSVVPFLFTYGQAKGDETMKDKALSLLDELPPESNSIIDMWRGMGIKTDSAFYTQALLQLKSNYCDKKRCLACTIGKRVIESD